VAELGEDFRTFILAQSSIAARIGARCYQNEVTQEGADVSDYVWFERASIEREPVLNPATGQRPFREFLNVEAVSTSISSVMALADDIRKLDGTQGAFGTGGQVLALFVNEHSDDYLPRQDMSDQGRHIAALQVEIIGHDPGT
jgi:hypothetical protein